MPPCQRHAHYQKIERGRSRPLSITLLLRQPSADSGANIEDFLAARARPRSKRGRTPAAGRLRRRVHPNPRWDVECAAQDNAFTRCQHCHLVEQAPRLAWNDAAEMLDVVRVLQPVHDEVGTLADDGRADLAGALAGHHQGEAEFPAFLGDPLERLSGDGDATILILMPRANVVVGFFQNDYPRRLKARLGCCVLP